MRSPPAGCGLADLADTGLDHLALALAATGRLALGLVLRRAVADLVDVAGAHHAQDTLLVGVLGLHHPGVLLLAAQVDQDRTVLIGGDLVTDLLAELVRLLELSLLLVARLDTHGGLRETLILHTDLGGQGEQRVQLVHRLRLENALALVVQDVRGLEHQLLRLVGGRRHIGLLLRGRGHDC
jgi:hypothetical protein